MNISMHAFITILFAVLFLLPICDPALHAQEAAVAVVTGLSGKATLRQGETELELMIGQELFLENIVTVQIGVVSIVFMDGDFLEIQKNESLTVGKDALSSALESRGGERGIKEDDVVSVGAGLEIPNAVKRMAQLAHVSAVRGVAQVIPVSPRLIVASPVLTFVWFDGDSAGAGDLRRYILTIRDEDGRTMYRRTLRGRVYSLNSHTLRNARRVIRSSPGKRYTWSIRARGRGMERSVESEARFLITDSTGMAEAERRVKDLNVLLKKRKIDNSTYNMLLGIYFIDERRRLFADALPQYLALAERFPMHAFPFEQLCVILQKFGNDVSVVGNYCAWRAEMNRDR